MLACTLVCTQFHEAIRAGAADPSPTPPLPPPIALPPVDSQAAGQPGGRPEAVITLESKPTLDPRPTSARPPSQAPESLGLHGCTDCGELGGAGAQDTGTPGFCQGPRPATLQQAIAERLVEEAYNRGSTDNLAAVVVDLGLRDWAAHGGLHDAGPRHASHAEASAPEAAEAGGRFGMHAVRQNRQAEAHGENAGQHGRHGSDGGDLRNPAAAAAGEHAVAVLRPSSLVGRAGGAFQSTAVEGPVLGGVSGSFEPGNWPHLRDCLSSQGSCIHASLVARTAVP